jgi:signal transduction histidine kinase/CheY-like chemotaxis protein
MCVVGGSFGLIMTFVQNSDIMSKTITTLLPVLALILLAVGNVIQNYKLVSVILVSTLCVICFPIVFFLSGGVESGMLAWLLLGSVMVTILLRGKAYFIILPLYVVVCMLTILFSYYHPELVVPISGSFMVYTDVAMSFALVSTLIAVSIKYMMKEYNEARKSAEYASRAKGNFLSNMSHEMRTPMNAIIGMTQIALETEDPARKDYCLNRIDDASRHLLNVINDILDMSKIEENKLSLSDVTFDLRASIENVRLMNSFRADDKNLRLEVSVDEAVPTFVTADDVHLAQVLTNLIGNAIKFTPKGGEVQVHVKLGEEEEGGEAQSKAEDENNDIVLYFSVSDTGIGMTKEQQQKLFSPFLQADSSISRRFGGTGLGLAISKSIVKMMGGKMDVTSEVDKGSVFFFTIHAKKASEEEIAAAEAESSYGTMNSDSERGGFSNYTILLAEDIDINREIVISLLEKTGVTIDEAINGVEAVEMFGSNPKRYDLILMDIQMPEMSGEEAAIRIRAMDDSRAKKIPIIAMTANVFKEDIEKYRSIGIDDHIGKPLDFDEVITKLKRFLTTR